MTEINAGRVERLYRYPIKGFSPDPLEAVRLVPGGPMPFDRMYAITNGPGPFDPAQPVHLPKLHFVMLMRNEQLAQFTVRFEEATHTLTLSRNGSVVASGDLRSDEGRAAVEAAVTEAVGAGLRGPARVVSSDGHSFSDVAEKCVHIINLASVRTLGEKIGADLNPVRFRPNIVFDGLPAWSEFEMVGQRIRAGGVILEGFKRTERCAATNVNPATAERDQKIPSFLSRTYGHTDFGVYARVVAGGEVRIGDGFGVA